MRTVIFGTGGVGGYFGARLAQAGADVLFIARGAHLDAIREDGLRLRSIRGDVDLDPAEAADSLAASFQPELVLMCVKTWQLEAAARAIQPALGDDTVVVPLLNGVEAADTLAEILGRHRVMPGLCGIIAYIEAPGVIRHVAADPFVTFGEFDNETSPRARRLLDLFARAEGGHAEIPADIHAALWMKFLMIVSTSGVGAVTRAPIGITREQPGTRKLLRAAMEEVCALAAARGVALPADAVDRAFAMIDGLGPQSTTSMQRDLAEGRQSELEAQAGAVVRLAAESGVAVPVNEFIYAALLPTDLQARGEIEFPE